MGSRHVTENALTNFFHKVFIAGGDDYQIMKRSLVYTAPDRKPIADLYVRAALEDRCAPRVSLRIGASLRPSGSQGFLVTVVDISIAGFSCEGVSGMHPGNRCWLNLPGLSGLQSEVVWNSSAIIGCAFDTLLHSSVLDRILANNR
jgi:hypothetical protein